MEGRACADKFTVDEGEMPPPGLHVGIVCRGRFVLDGYIEARQMRCILQKNTGIALMRVNTDVCVS